MKRIVLAVLMALLLSSTAHAIPVEYKITGHLEQLSLDAPGTNDQEVLIERETFANGLEDWLAIVRKHLV